MKTEKLSIQWSLGQGRKKEIKDFLDFNEHEGKTYPNLWDAYAHTHEANKPKNSRWQEIIKLRPEINQLDTKWTMQRINKAKSWFFEKISKIDISLGKLTKSQRDSTQINKIRNEMET